MPLEKHHINDLPRFPCFLLPPPCRTPLSGRSDDYSIKIHKDLNSVLPKLSCSNDFLSRAPGYGVAIVLRLRLLIEIKWHFMLKTKIIWPLTCLSKSDVQKQQQNPAKTRTPPHKKMRMELRACAFVSSHHTHPPSSCGSWDSALYSEYNYHCILYSL